MAAESGLSISDMTLANEQRWRSEAEIRAGLLERWHVMQACVERG
jgi:L-serine dehydratase